MSKSLDEGSWMRRTPEQHSEYTERSAWNGMGRLPSIRPWWDETSSSSAWSSWGGIMRVGDLMRLDGTPEMRSLTGPG